MPKTIVWKKWKDPCTAALDIKASDTDDFDKKVLAARGPCIVGAQGIIPLFEGNVPSVLYNFWIAHTNFVVTHKVKDLIKETNGVEVLDVFTPYRFRIAFGKAFDENDVKRRIEFKLIRGCYAPINRKTILNKWASKIDMPKWWIYEKQGFMTLYSMEQKDNEDNLIMGWYQSKKDQYEEGNIVQNN